MYLEKDKTVYATLAIGEKYRMFSETLIESVLKFTDSDLYVVTDAPEAYGDFFDLERIHYVKLDENLTDLPLIYKKETFNYNLKMVPIHYVMEQIKPEMTVYMDCDAFLWGTPPPYLHRAFPSGISARLRQPLNDSGQHQIVLDKLAAMGVDYAQIDVKMPIEHIMFFKSNTLFPQFFKEWYNFAKLSYEKDCISFFESVEMSLAMWHSKIPHYHLDNSHFIVDNFRLLHQGEKIMKPFVI